MNWTQLIFKRKKWMWQKNIWKELREFLLLAGIFSVWGCSSSARTAACAPPLWPAPRAPRLSPPCSTASERWGTCPLLCLSQRICGGFRAPVTWAWYCPLFGQPGCPHWAVIGRMSEIVHGIIEVEMVLEPLKRWGRQQQLAETQTRSFGISGKCHQDCPDRSW